MSQTDEELATLEANLEATYGGYLDELDYLKSDIAGTKESGTKWRADPNNADLSNSFEARLAYLEATFDKFQEVFDKAKPICQKLNRDANVLKNFRTSTREIFYEAVALSRYRTTSTANVNEISRQSSSNTAEPSRPLNLPKLKLPEFNGEIEKWPAFHDSFKALFHDNSSLDESSKFHYLKSCLDGQALQCISTIPVTAQNYRQAWDVLCKRYMNTRLLATTCLTKIFNFKPFSRSSPTTLEQFSSVVLESAETFRKLDIEDKTGFILFTFALRLVDNRTRERFESEYGNGPKIPSFTEFANFIHQQHINMQTTTLTTYHGTMNSTLNKSPNSSKHVFLSTATPTKSRQCPICKNTPHRLVDCLTFQNMDPSSRLERIKNLGRCFSCFSSQHQVTECTSEKRCRICNQKHHTLIHVGTQEKSETPSNEAGVKSRIYHNSQTSSTSTEKETSSKSASAKDNSPNPATVLSTSTVGEINVLLATARARVVDSTGNYCSLRLLIDSGSQRSFITRKCAERLTGKMKKNKERLLGLGGLEISGGSTTISCVLIPERLEGPRISTEAIVLEQICPNMPSCKITVDLKHALGNKPLADPTLDQPGPIDFLLGADMIPDVFTGKIERCSSNLPTAYETIFGWVLLGKIAAPTKSATLSLIAVSHTPIKSENLDELLKSFWNTEEVEEANRIDPEEALCEQHFLTTYSRNDDGRYVVRLPFREQPVQLGESRNGALKRYQKLEYRFVKDQEFKLSYDKVLQDYLQQQYFSESKSSGKYFLPHHGVTKDSSTTKLRIVFDASYKTDGGSLNDKLLTGPKLQRDIKDVILRFRNFRIALTNDIYQMYPQIIVDQQDRAYQHFFHRFDTMEKVVEYEFNRLTFGMSCSPFIALRVIKQLIKEEGYPFPKATQILTHNVYMDDILTGGDTVDEAKEIQRQTENLLKRGGFTLKEWCSNVRELTPNTTNLTPNLIVLTGTEDTAATQKILGMIWKPKQDEIAYNVQTFEFVPTKRGLMSTIARMYDPLGYLAPVIFKAKCILQELWRENLEWDTPIPARFLTEWRRLFDGLPELKKITIPRCFFTNTVAKINVIGFADASSHGYAAVVYLHLLYSNDTTKNFLLLSKTKVAPIKPMTIPRLELCGALLLVKSMRTLNDYFSSLPLPISETFFLSDSKTVLAWIQVPYHRLKVFVANRVAAILDSSSIDQWFHVRSENNAADLASRGMNPADFVKDPIWFPGPPWMSTPQREWPIITAKTVEESSEEGKIELKSETMTLIAMSGEDQLPEIMEKFSSFTRMIHVLSYVRRFVNTLRKRESRTGILSLTEIRETTTFLIKRLQEQSLTTELSTKYKSLNPFRDSLGVFRVGGRLNHAPLPYDTKFPILLPSKSRFVELLIDHLHLSYLHAGPQLLLAMFRRSYWITAARSVIRKRIRLCLTCHRMKTKAYQPQMAPLPSSRFETSRPFIHTGIDFAGPFRIKESQRRKAALGKAYFCLFICMATKAVHIELVSQLTTDAFLASLDRFISRRGIPKRIFSDNGKNFVGANRRLSELYNWWSNETNSNAIEVNLTDRKIEWSFIPPAAPHFGGLWEAGVKSLKFHLVRVVGEQTLTFEELSTLGIRIEAVLNSRPLYPLSADSEDFDVLTPGHFLIGAPLASLPEEDLSDISSNRLSRWQFLQKCIRSIWKKWSSDYLTTLQPRQKWTKTEANLTPGTMVLLREEDTIPLAWTIGRVVETYMGRDGTVRVAKIKTTSGERVRPVVRLSPLFPEELSNP